MTKHSKFERAQRSAETDRMRAIEANWVSQVPADVMASFKRDVDFAQSRQLERQPDMAPGTLPNPPRPGREPKPPKEQAKGRSRY
jgi:hypothetical protein